MCRKTKKTNFYSKFKFKFNQISNNFFYSTTRRSRYFLYDNPADLKFYQTLHLDFGSGFILLPTGQLKALAKSTEFDNGPLTLNTNNSFTFCVSLLTQFARLYLISPGLCTDVLIFLIASLSFIAPHQIYSNNQLMSQ